jgi:hypothetical protein
MTIKSLVKEAMCYASQKVGVDFDINEYGQYVVDEDIHEFAEALIHCCYSLGIENNIDYECDFDGDVLYIEVL